MEENPYCNLCCNSLYVNEFNRELIGFCDVCHTRNSLTEKQNKAYLHNQKCKIVCDCGRTAYIKNKNDFYECNHCFKKIPLTAETKEYIANRKNKL